MYLIVSWSEPDSPNPEESKYGTVSSAVTMNYCTLSRIEISVIHQAPSLKLERDPGSCASNYVNTCVRRYELPS